MKLVIKKLLEVGMDPRKIFFISLDEYTLKDKPIAEILDDYRGIMKLSVDEKIFVFFDEVTYKPDFDIELKNLYDSQNVKVFASASNSFLLQDKKAYLTGRSKLFAVNPLTFNEFLLFKNTEIKKKDQHLFDSYFEDYLKSGGIPEYVLTGDFEYIKNLVDDIIYKDIAAVHGIRDLSLLKDFFLLLMERAGKQLSLNKMASILSVSVDTVSRYQEYFFRTFLIQSIQRHGKTNERVLSPKKVYAADTGIRNYFTGFRDKGSLFENYVFNRIKHLNPQYVYQDQTEIDFLTENGILAEAKYHNEPLSPKQQKLFDAFTARAKIIIRNEDDIGKMVNGEF
jgi:predicted AAA+ superfamily ATPase